MPTLRAERRLAAILAADIVAYSRLIEADEARTLAAIRAVRSEVLNPLIAENKGRIVKLMGDGAIVEFGSIVDAVSCAVAIQEAVAVHQQEIVPENRILFRIGINVGDVVVEDGDLVGDGVNIAARLETLAEPGGICIADAAQKQLAGKTDFAFEDAGERTLKNIARPVRIWRWTAETSASAVGASIPLQGRPSIAVLPFDNLSGQADDTYFSDGITEDIITGLARFRSLFVIARNSSFAFRGKPIDLAEIGRRLGASYILEGSIRRVGEKARITAQLIEAAHGTHVWAERYDRSLKDIFAVQDEVARTIVSTLFGRIQEVGMERSSRMAPASLTAYDCLLRGIAHFRSEGEGENERACEMFERAIALDPNYGLAHSYLALVRTTMHGSATAPAEVLNAEFARARHGLDLDPQEGRCHRILSAICLLRREYDMADQLVRQALLLNPSDADNLMQKGRVLAMRGRSEEALECLDAAVRLNPLHPPWYNAHFGVALYSLRRFDEAMRALRSMPFPGTWSLARLAACYGQLELAAEARATTADILRLEPDFSSANYIRTNVLLERAEDRELLREGLIKAGLPA